MTRDTGLVCTLHKVPTDDEIVQLRTELGLTQSQFAELLGVSRHTVQSWELNRNDPSGIAAKTLNMLKSKPRLVRRLLEAA